MGLQSPSISARPDGLSSAQIFSAHEFKEGNAVASAVTMTNEHYEDLLAEEIRKLESEFKSRRDNGRRMSRSVAAAYRKSIERRTEELRNIHRKS